MLHNRPVKLKVSTGMDFALPVRLLNSMVVIAALLSPHPLLLTVPVALVLWAGWVRQRKGLFKTKSSELISIIFPDGHVRLESKREVIFEGFLNGQQWCSRRLTVLRICNEDSTRKLVIQSAKQQVADDFRRLNMWLRQDLCNNTRGKQVLSN